MTVTRVGNVDIQFQPQWDFVKGNQLVQSLQQVVQQVNRNTAAIADLQTAGGGSSVAVHVLASTAGLGVDHSVSGLTAGQVLVAASASNALFRQLALQDLAVTDGPSIIAATEGEVLTYHNGFWAAKMPTPLGLGDPGSFAVVEWNETAHAFAWALPDPTIKITAGAIGVDDTKLDHSHLEGLQFTVASGGTTVANDHPQYVMLAAANVWPALQTFAAGIVVAVSALFNTDITLAGNLEQSGVEPEWRITDAQAQAVDEAAWRIHVEPGMWMMAAVNDDGSDGENWLQASRQGSYVDNVNVSSNSLTWNGAQVLTTDYVPPTQSNPTFTSPITVPDAITLSGIEPLFTATSTQVQTSDEAGWQLHIEPGQLIWSTLDDSGSWGENWLTVSRANERVESINLSADSFTFNGDVVYTPANLVAGVNAYLSTDSFGRTVINAATSSGGSGTPAAPTTSVQFNNAGAFGGSANLTWSGVQLYVGSDGGGAGGAGVRLQLLTSAGYAYQRFNDQLGNRELELLFIGSTATPAYGGAAGDSVVNVNSGTLWLSTADTGRVSVNHAGDVVVAAPTSGTAVTVNGVAAFNTMLVQASTSTGNSFGLSLLAGTNATDAAIAIKNASASAQFFRINGDGSGALGPTAALGLAWTAAGAFNLVAPTAGTAFVMNGVANSNTVEIRGASTSAQSFGLVITAGTTAADYALIVDNQNASVQFMKIFGDGHGTLGPTSALGFAWSVAGNVTLGAPASGSTLFVNMLTGSTAGVNVDVSAAGAASLRNYVMSASGATAAVYGIGIENATANFTVSRLDSARTLFASTPGGNFSIPLSSSGIDLTLASSAGRQSFFGSGINIGLATAFLAGQGEVYTTSTTAMGIGTSGSAALHMYTSSALALTIAANGQITSVAPGSGTAVTINGINGQNILICQDGTQQWAVQTDSTTTYVGTLNSKNFALMTNNAARWQIDASTGGLFAQGVTGSSGGAGTVNAVGYFVAGDGMYATLPISATVSGAVARAANLGKCIAATGNLTLASATFSAGDIIYGVNNSAGSITISGTITTIRLAGTATTGTRTVAARGSFSLFFLSASEVYVSGAGVT